MLNKNTTSLCRARVTQICHINRHILTSLQLPFLVKLKLDELAEPTTVVVHHGASVAERL